MLVSSMALIPKVYAGTSSIIKSPNGNSTPLQCDPYPAATQNYADVDEYPTPDDAATTVSMNGLQSICEDNYTIASPGVPDGATINNITVTLRASAIIVHSTKTHQAASRITVDKQAYYGTALSITAAWITFSQTFVNASWTAAMVNAMFIGLKLTTNDPLFENSVSVTQEFVNITYTSAGAPPSWHSIKIWDQLDTRQWFSIGFYEILNTRAWHSVSWFEQLFTPQWHSIVWQMILLVRDNSWDLGGALVGALIFFPMLIIGIAYIRRKK